MKCGLMTGCESTTVSLFVRVPSEGVKHHRDDGRGKCCFADVSSFLHMSKALHR
jgi:hypothetical protein